MKHLLKRDLNIEYCTKKKFYKRYNMIKDMFVLKENKLLLTEIADGILQTSYNDFISGFMNIYGTEHIDSILESSKNIKNIVFQKNKDMPKTFKNVIFVDMCDTYNRDTMLNCIHIIERQLCDLSELLNIKNVKFAEDDARNTLGFCVDYGISSYILEPKDDGGCTIRKFVVPVIFLDTSRKRATMVSTVYHELMHILDTAAVGDIYTNAYTTGKCGASSAIYMNTAQSIRRSYKEIIAYVLQQIPNLSKRYKGRSLKRLCKVGLHVLTDNISIEELHDSSIYKIHKNIKFKNGRNR